MIIVKGILEDNMFNVNKIKEILKNKGEMIDNEIKRFISTRDDIKLYQMMEYFLGFREENLSRTEGYGGKRFRSSLTLLLSEYYGNTNKSLEISSAIELFHNFTLIHDDIEDNDEYRRGRLSLWKLFGLDHGINTGDGQLILANIELMSGIKKHKLDLSIHEFLNDIFLEVIEGQFLDFTLASKNIEDDDVNVENYLKMIEKKTCVLVGASTKVAGLIHGQSEVESNNLWEYGLNLGFAHQVFDDLASIWARKEDTGKEEKKDIYEHKKTLPVLYTFSKLDPSEKEAFISIYNKQEVLSEEELNYIVSLLDKYNAYDYCWERVQEYSKRAGSAVDKLNISDNGKETLYLLISELLPSLKEVCKC